jgi:hypothetical protein
MWTAIIILAVVFVIFRFAFMRGVGRQNAAYEEALEFESHEPKGYKYKTPFDDKLIELGVKEQWDANWEKQGLGEHETDHYKSWSFCGFISVSF